MPKTVGQDVAVVSDRDEAVKGGARWKRITAALAIAASVVLVAAPAAAAAPAPDAPPPPEFVVPLYHNSGTLVARVQGKLAWSTSGRTVSFTQQQLYVREGECVYLVYAGYQSNTLVASSGKYKACGGDGLLPDASLATDVPGGIQHVIIELTDVAHGNRASDDCFKTEFACRSRS